jgi:hypothetical protein
MTDEKQVAALREEIREAGSSVAALRWITALALCLPMAVLTVVTLVLAGCFEAIRVLAFGCLLNLLLVTGIALPFVAWGRQGRREWLECRLGLLSPEQRAEVLLPLLKDRSSDTRKIVEPLVRQYRVSSELTPATAPAARGDEPSPADHAHAARLAE